jgi:enoyl-CoA hydratase/carnithine racemase
MRKESVMNTTAENTVITERSGALQLIELNRPEKSNAVRFAMYDDLTGSD